MMIPIDPTLPEGFDGTPNEERPASHRAWWGRPYVVRMHWGKIAGPRSTEEDRAKWFGAWPSGIRYDVHCLDGGAWDRPTTWGSFATLDEAIACAKAGPPWRRAGELGLDLARKAFEAAQAFGELVPCDSCGVLVPKDAIVTWGPPESARDVAEVLEALGYKMLVRRICPRCQRCVVCGADVAMGEGAPALPPFPSVHTRCLGHPEAAGITEQLKAALLGKNRPVN